MYLQDELVQDYCEHSARSSRERVRGWGIVVQEKTCLEDQVTTWQCLNQESCL